MSAWTSSDVCAFYVAGTPDQTKEENVMVEFITNVNSAVNGFVWGVPMLVLLVGTGILMTILTKFFQLSHWDTGSKTRWAASFTMSM